MGKQGVDFVFPCGKKNIKNNKKKKNKKNKNKIKKNKKRTPL